MRILINALSGIGDAVMFSPALSVLKKHLPNSQIDILVMFQQVGEIYKLNKKVHRIHFIDFLHQSKFKSLRQIYKIRRNNYDVSIDVYPSNRKEYNLLNFMLGASRRVSTKYDNYSGANWDFLNTELRFEVKNRHNVLQNFDLVRVLAPEAKEEEAGDLEINISLEDEVHATEYLIDNNLTDKFITGFHAGSATFKRHINKRWAADKYIKLAEELNQKHDAHVLLFGTEQDVNEYINRKIPDITSIPKSNNIMQSIALMEKCKLFVSNDTALMHVAAGLKIPTVAIFGYTNYKELFPWNSRHIIVRKELECSPCFFNSPKPVQCIFSGGEEFKCMKTIEVDDVLEAAEKLIQEIPGNIEP
jgi:lipopolysaccharide heptosyltransferase II